MVVRIKRKGSSLILYSTLHKESLRRDDVIIKDIGQSEECQLNGKPMADPACLLLLCNIVVVIKYTTSTTIAGGAQTPRIHGILILSAQPPWRHSLHCVVCSRVAAQEREHLSGYWGGGKHWRNVDVIGSSIGMPGVVYGSRWKKRRASQKRETVLSHKHLLKNRW